MFIYTGDIYKVWRSAYGIRAIITKRLQKFVNNIYSSNYQISES